MNVLELFSGTGSVGKVCKEIGWNVISVDLELEATHKEDILSFDYKQYPQDHFSMIWASPPCLNYSICKNCWLGRPLKQLGGKIYTPEIREELRKESDKLVSKTLEIIDYFKPEVWYMENPASSDLKNRDIVKGLPYYVVDYCMYCDWGYKKSTRIWTNVIDFIPRTCNGKCGNIIDVEGHVYHKVNLGKTKQNQLCSKYRQKHKIDIQGVGGGTNRLMRYRIPPDLIKDLLGAF